MRLFAALEITPDAREAIVALQRRLAPAVGGPDAALKWNRPDQMHLTLVFIGSVDPAAAAAMIGACQAPIASEPFELAFAGIGVFPPRGAPRVLWLGVGAGADDVRRVQMEVAGRLAAAGAPLEARPFHPHVTLARWKASRGADARRVAAVRMDGASIHTIIDGVTLFESRQSPAGSVYIPLARAPLAGPRGHPLQ
jgi:2'-5' RNA ligase